MRIVLCFRKNSYEVEHKDCTKRFKYVVIAKGEVKNLNFVGYDKKISGKNNPN